MKIQFQDVQMHTAEIDGKAVDIYSNVPFCGTLSGCAMKPRTGNLSIFIKAGEDIDTITQDLMRRVKAGQLVKLSSILQ
ncbi:MAG: hypothetical protein RR415_11285 [Ruthenibacterium sp.]